jgi:6-phosphogluconolactonase
LKLFIGTYTSDGSEGIYASDLDETTGQLSAPRCVVTAAQPSYVAVHPGRRFLYAVNELSEPDGRSVGSVSAFALPASAGPLAFINSRPSAGGGPCHVSCHPGGRWVAAANYASGTAAVFPVGMDGALGEASCVVSHPTLPATGSAARNPHAHCLVFAAGGEWAFVADLGLDRLMIYRFDQERGTLHAHDPAFVETKPGAGPRALSFFPDGRRACLVNELDSTLTLLDLDPARRNMRSVDTKSTLPTGWTGANACADVHVHPNGRFVFCSNRGHDSIALFAVRGDKLSLLGHQPTGGRTPRSFCIDPAGRWLLAANQHTHDIHCFRIDPAGTLRPTGAPVSVRSPVCLKLVPGTP